MSEFKSQSGATPHFRRAKAGEQPSAAEYNKLLDAVVKLYQYVSPYNRIIDIELIRLDQAIGPVQDFSSDFLNRDGYVQYYDRENRVFQENGEDRRTEITDPMELVWDVDEQVPMFYHRQSAQWIPLNPRTTRNAITWPDADGSYPGRPANKYPIKFVRFEYDDFGADFQVPTVVFIDSQSTVPASQEPDDYVLNINSNSLLVWFPRRTPLEVYNVIGRNGQQQWYTNSCCDPEVEYSGSSDEISSEQFSSDISSDISSTTQDVSSTTQDISSDVSSNLSGLSGDNSSSGPAGICTGTCAYIWNTLGPGWQPFSECVEHEPVECISCLPGFDGTFDGEVASQPCEAVP